jgi:dienelactone hydrolase
MRKFSLFVALCCFTISVFAQNYPRGFQTITYNDPNRANRAVAVDIYYPAVSAGSNTPVANDSFPFVVFGHGFVIATADYSGYADSLVKKGFIVAMPSTESTTGASHPNFAQDLIFIYNKLISESATNVSSPFYQKVRKRGAIGGHSMGGGSTLLSCSYSNVAQCYFTFAAANTNPSSISASKLMTKPYLDISGIKDCVAKPSTDQIPMYDSSSSPCKYYIGLKDATHCQFATGGASLCYAAEGLVTLGCSSSPYLTKPQQTVGVLNYLVPYLTYYLKGDCSAWTQFITTYNADGVNTKKSSCSNTVPTNPSIAGNLTFCTGQSTTLTANPAGFSYVWNNNSTANTLSVNAAGTYSVVVGNGVCALPAVTATVTQKSTPATPSAITLNDTVCTGIAGITAAVTNDPSATQYNWTLPSGWSITQGNNTNSIQATSGASGGTVQVTAQNSCGTSAASQKSVVVLPSNLGTAGAITGSQTLCKSASGNYSIATVSGATAYTWTYPSGWNVSGASNSNTITLSPSTNAVSGQITVAAANNCGNSTPSSLTVQVNATPVLGSINGPSTVWLGKNAGYKVNVSSTGTIAWTNPGFQVLSGAGTDSIYVLAVGPSGANSLSVSAQNTCGTATPASQSVTVVDSPQVSITQQGNDLTLNNLNGGSIVWYQNGQVINTNSPTITPGAAGSYQAQITNSNGCTGWTNMYNYVVSGLNDVASNTAIKIYPNPAKDIAIIHINPNQLGEELKVTDANGRVVNKLKMTETELILVVKEYSKGLYLISIGDAKQKFVVE